MKKTPDEIKKGLDYLCTTDVRERVKKFKEGIPYAYAEDVAADGLVLIQQLQAENAEKDARIQQLEAERDAAVAGLKSNCTCPECKYFSDDIQEPCRGCKPTDSKFEWRGIQKD